MSSKSHKHGSGESYRGVILTKHPNQGGRPPAEGVEGRPLAKEMIPLVEPHPELVPGSHYLVYLRWGGTLKLDLRSSPDQHLFRYTWFELAEGKEASGGTVPGGQMREFHAPEDYPRYPRYKDWLLHVRGVD